MLMQPGRRRGGVGSLSPARSTRRNYNEEQGQTFIIERQNSIHTRLAMLNNSDRSRSGGGGGGGGGGSGGNITNNNNNNSGVGGYSPKILSRPGSYSQFIDISAPTNYNNENQSLLALTSSSFYGSQSSINLQPPQVQQQVHTIRFQVVVWNIGKLDVVTGSVPMTFRVSLFWNDISMNNDDDFLMDDNNTLGSTTSHRVWTMHGRTKAYQHELVRSGSGGGGGGDNDSVRESISVPPLAILNVSTFETIGGAEIDMLRESTRLMRWTCMYRATVVQENLRVDEFPHDDHDIHLKLAILSQRSKGAQWDKRKWKLSLATMDDTQSSTRVPHGLIVGQARMPGFTFNKDRGLEFQFCALDHGFYGESSSDDDNNNVINNSVVNNSVINNKKINNKQSLLYPSSSSDVYLKVSLNVLRESGYYDKNIVPLLALLNVVAVSVLTLRDTEFFQRGLLTLNMAFVEMSIRMTTDTHLPGVDYEIRLQRILNEFFVVLMMLVLEAMSVYVLRTYYDVSPLITITMDWTMGIFAMSHNAYTVFKYYKSKQRAVRRLHYGWQDKKDE